MKIEREKVMKLLKPAMNVIIIASVGTAMFRLGIAYQNHESKENVKVENPYENAIFLYPKSRYA